jgi:hypothetical protein
MIVASRIPALSRRLRAATLRAAAVAESSEARRATPPQRAA